MIRMDARMGWRAMSACVALAAVLATGCESKQDKAIDAAKKQAAASGQTQQVISVNSNGTTTTTTVQPPQPGQTAEQVTSTTAPTQTAAGTPPPQPGVYYQPVGTAQPAADSSTAPADSSAPAPAPAPAPVSSAPVAAADVNIPAGSELAIEINQRISTKTTPPGSSFSGEVVESWTDGHGRVILPRGTPVEGRVVESHNGGHFKGASVLELRLTSLTLNGTRYPLRTHDVVREKKGKGKRTAGFIGGGSGLGMVLGAIAGGGKGALIGGLAGAGAGTAGAGLTDNRPLDIPAESIVHFRLADALTLEG